MSDSPERIHEYNWVEYSINGNEESFEELFDELVDDGVLYPSDDGNVVVDMSEVDEEIVEDRELLHFILRQKVNPDIGHIAFTARNKEDYRNDALVEITGQTDVVETQSLSDLSLDDHEYLVNLECRVQDVKESAVNKFTNKWKCPEEHTTICKTPRWMPESEKPVSCSGYNPYADEEEDCGQNPYKKVPNKGYSNTVQQLVLGELEVDDRNSTSVVGEMDVHLVDSVERRNKVNVWARVMIADDDSNKVDYYLHIVGIDSYEEEVELNEETIARVEEMQESSEDIIQDLADSVAPHVVPRIGHDAARKAVLSSIVRGNTNAVGDRNTINTLLYGKKGGAKTDIIEAADELSVISRYVDGTEVSQPGLTASTRKNEIMKGDDSWMVTPGAIPQAHTGILCFDELDKTDWSIKDSLTTPMESGFVKVDRVAEGKMEADVSFVCTANPEEQSYDGLAPIHSLDLPGQVQDRFDIIIRVDDYIDDREAEMEAQKEIRRRKREGVNPPFETQEMKEYLAYARTLEPEISDKADEMIVEKIVDMRITVKDLDAEGISVSGRLEGKITRLSEAMAKLRLADVVTVTDVKRALSLVKEGWEGITADSFGLVDDEDYMVAVSINNPSQKQLYRQTLDVLGLAEGSESTIPIEVVYGSIDASEGMIDMALSNLTDKGHITVHDDDVEVLDLPGDKA